MEGIGKMKEMNGVAAEWLDRIRADVFEMRRKLKEVRHRIDVFPYDKREFRAPCFDQIAELEIELFCIVDPIAAGDKDESYLEAHLHRAVYRNRCLDNWCRQKYFELTYKDRRSIKGVWLLDLEQVLLVISLRLCDCPKIIDSIAGERK